MREFMTIDLPIRIEENMLEGFDSQLTNQLIYYDNQGTLSANWIQCNQTIKFSYGKPSSESYAYDMPDAVGYHRNLTKRNCQALILR